MKTTLLNCFLDAANIFPLLNWLQWILPRAKCTFASDVSFCLLNKAQREFHSPFLWTLFPLRRVLCQHERESNNLGASKMSQKLLPCCFSASVIQVWEWQPVQRMWSLLSKMFHKMLSTKCKWCSLRPSYLLLSCLNTAGLSPFMDIYSLRAADGTFGCPKKVSLVLVPSSNLAGVNKRALSSQARNLSGVKRNWFSGEMRQ